MQRIGLEFWYRVSQDPSLIWKKRHYADFHRFVLPVLWQALRERVGGKSSATV
jgi:UDP-N-acetyl-D-mannosaminuronic acid transferase (WecB/TagA/CpsF family)